MDEVGKIRRNIRSPVVRQWRSLGDCAMGASWNAQDFNPLNSALKTPNSGYAKTEYCVQLADVALAAVAQRYPVRDSLA